MSFQLSTTAGLLLGLIATGCTTSSLYLTPRIAPVMTSAGLGAPVTHFSARTHKGYLEVEVTLAQDERDYKTNLDLELECAARICAAIARSDAAFECEWQAMELKMDSQYGSGLKWRTTVSYLIVKISRETFVKLRENNFSSSVYSRYWRFVYASKVVPPGSKSWREWWPADFEMTPDHHSSRF